MKFEEEVKKLEGQGYKVQGGFRNEHRERYYIFTHHLIHGYLIAGDETDWQIMHVAENPIRVYTPFLLSEYEVKEIESILKTLKKK